MGIRFIGRYIPSGRLRVTALSIVPQFAVKPSISPAGAQMGTLVTGNDGTIRGALVTKRRWLLNGVAIAGVTGNTYTTDGTGSLVYEVTAEGRGGMIVASSDPVTITPSVIPQHAPVWRTKPGLLGTFAEGTSVSIPLQADDQENNIQSYSIVSGELPNGLSIDLFNGLISGSLAEVTKDTSYTFGVRVVDRTNLSITGTFTINVANVKTTVTWETDNTAPLAEPAPGQPVNIQVGASSN